MRTTTVVWSAIPDLTLEQIQDTKQRREEFAVELAGELYKSDLQRDLDDDSTTLTVRRAWPDLATAEAWVSYVLAEGALSAVVDPE